MGISDQQNLNLSPEIFVKDFNWVNTWVNNHFIKVNEKIFTFLIFSFLILLILKFKLKTQNTKINLPNFHKYILLLFLIYVIIWFLSSPLFRYGTGLIVVLVILIINPLVLRYFNYGNNNPQFLKIFMIFLIITTIVVKNIIRISNDIGNDLIPKTFDNI